MKTIDELLKKNNHTAEELNLIIIHAKRRHPVSEKCPQHCGICELFRFCKIINHKLICPWR